MFFQLVSTFPVATFFTLNLRKRCRPANVFIEPAGSSTSPSGDFQTVRIPSSYDGRVDHSSNGSAPARRPTASGTSARPRAP